MLKGIKESALKGADATARAAKRTTLLTEIKLIEGKIGDAKMHLGKVIYSALVRARAPAPVPQPVARSRASACEP